MNAMATLKCAIYERIFCVPGLSHESELSQNPVLEVLFLKLIFNGDGDQLEPLALIYENALRPVDTDISDLWAIQEVSKPIRGS